jgi:hypothetical protein
MELAFGFGDYQLRLIRERENDYRWISQRLRENNSNIRLQMKDFFPPGGIAKFFNKGTSRGSVFAENYYEPPPEYSSVFSTPSDASAASTQHIPIEEALSYATNKISTSIPPGSIIAIDDISLNYAELSNYIKNMLATNMDNKGLFKIILRDKDQLEKINEEVARFLSGNVSDESQISLVGHDLLPDTLITGSIIYTEDTYQLFVRAIDLEGKNIRPNSTYSASILNDITMQGLTGNRSNSASSTLGGKINVSPVSESWENNRLYLGLSLGGGFLPFPAMLNPNPNSDSSSFSDFHLTFSIAPQITDWFGIQTGLIYSYDMEDMEIPKEMGFEHFTATLYQHKLTIPLLAKFSLRSQNFLFGGLGGAYFTIPKGEMNHSDTINNRPIQITYAPISHSAGVILGAFFGYPVGPGVLSVDISFIRDFIPTKYGVTAYNTLLGNYYKNISARKWSVIDISIGYELGLFKKR